jgi:hypothetical protein
MTKLNTLSVLCILAIILATVNPSYSGITYTNSSLKINGGDSTASYGVDLKQMNGVTIYNRVVAGIVTPPGTGTLSTGSASGIVSPQLNECRLSIYVGGENPELWSSTGRINFYNHHSKTYNSLYAAGVYNLSDGRSKQDVADLADGLGSMMRLRPVTFRWASPADGKIVECGEENSVTYGPEADKLQYGFIAQEIEEVLPDIVSTDADGNKAVNYTSLIPVLVRSVQELQGQVAAQSALIDNLNARLAMQANATVEQDMITSCTPNPTNGEISVGYALMSGTTDARILITNLIGTTVCEAECSRSGTSVCLNLSGTLPGVYLATLVCNGEVRDSRQIVVSR